MMFNNTILVSLAVFAGVGCATVPPPNELLDARAAYARAASGPARTNTPADLETARQAIEKAEHAFADDPTSDRTRDLAYIASRKVLTAEARGRSAGDEKARTDAEAQFRKDATNQLDSKNSALAGQAQRLNQTAQELSAEQTARKAAEARARDAMQRLSALAAIKQDTRGTVITLNGAVLFATNKSDLLPNANEKLNQVADALKETPDRIVTVYGFTDSQGDDAYNMKLSERRAESVRNYLVGRGLAADTIKSVGKGETEPVADNKNPEGRANNRRVEIVVPPPSDGSQGPSSTGGATK